MRRVLLAGVVGLAVGLAIASSRPDVHATLVEACELGDRAACCALGGPSGGAREDRALLRRACVELDPSPAEPLRHECSCLTLLELAPRGAERDALRRDLVAGRCARTDGPCPEERPMPDPVLRPLEPSPLLRRPRSPRFPDLSVPEDVLGLDRRTLETGIELVTAPEWVVRRALFERLLAGEATLAAATTLRARLVRGRRVGIVVGTLSPSGVAARLGLEEGDLLRWLNDVDLAADGAEEAARRELHAGSDFTLSLMRRRAPVMLAYHVR